MINNTCCVNSRLPVVRYRTITTRTIYYTVCTLYRTTLSRSILYYMEIVGNYLHFNAWSSYKLFTIIYKNLFDKIIVFQIDFYNFNHVIFIPPDQKAWVGLHLQNWKLLLFWQDVFNHRVNKNFSTPATKFPLSQAISYTFLDKHFLLIENMSSEASSRESFILLLFFQLSQNPFFQKSHFSKKSAPFFPLFSTILPTTRFCFAPFYADFVLQNLSNSLYFSHQILHSLAQFPETQFLTFLEARFWPSAPLQIPVNPYTNYLSTFAQNYSQKNA